MKKNTKKTLVITLIIFLFCVLMALTDGVFKANYLIKSIVKIVLFLILPVVYSFYDNEVKIKQMFVPDKKGLRFAISLGLLIYVVILGGYHLLKGVFDFSGITGALSKNAGVTEKNFVFVSLYISFVNSLLEEFFFRGFAFITLKRISSVKYAYIFSAGAFAMYHVAMMVGWFSLPVFLIIVAGLFVGGIIFNVLNEKSSTIYPSWLVHMFANFSINTVGFILFGII